MPPSAAFFIIFEQTLLIMRKSIIILLISLLTYSVHAQVAEMKWELDTEILFKMANDSNYTYDIREAFHVTDTKQEFSSNFVFYPVNPGEEYAKLVPVEENNVEYKTLWSALNAKIGGGWIHFINCIAYALETQQVDLTSPLMKRPLSNWKPKPMTESYLRTKKWEYYVPLDQKKAQKEYKIRMDENSLGDINSLPQSYIDLFLSTSQKDYDKFKADGKKNVIAKIDLVKLLLGSNYLGEAQITYISNMVLESVKSYSSNKLPSVIIFDEFDAAALMSLNADGYKIENIVFRSSANITNDFVEERTNEIERIIKQINAYNQESFKKRLGNYYKN
jgi:hypothetical protein